MILKFTPEFFFMITLYWTVFFITDKPVAWLCKDRDIDADSEIYIRLSLATLVFLPKALSISFEI